MWVPQDLPEAYSIEMLRNELRLEELQQRTGVKYSIKGCTALDAASILGAFDWIIMQAGERVSSPVP